MDVQRDVRTMLFFICVADISCEAKLFVSISMLMLQKSGRSRLSFSLAYRKARLCTDSQPIVLFVQHGCEMRDS